MRVLIAKLLGPAIPYLFNLREGDEVFQKNLILYQFDACPFCIKVRKALKRLNIKVEIRNILTNERFKEELIEGGGKKMVPCLKIAGENETTWLYESKDIIQYLEKRFS